MGGGPDHWAVEAHSEAGLKVYATAMPPHFDDDWSGVASMGIRRRDRRPPRTALAVLEMRGFYLEEFDGRRCERLASAPSFDAVAVAVFDHGAAPPGGQPTADFASILVRTGRARDRPWRALAFLPRNSGRMTRCRRAGVGPSGNRCS